MPSSNNVEQPLPDMEMWDRIWNNESEENQPFSQFFLPTVDKALGLQNAEGLNVLIPQCRKSPDLMYFYNLGCTVVGLEPERKLIDEFFNENKIEEGVCSTESVRMSADKRIYMVQGDLFAFTKDASPVDKFDVIWDCGSFEMTNREDRRKYVIHLASFLKEAKGMYLLQGLQCKKEEYNSIPRCVFSEDLDLEFPKHTSELIATQNLITEESLSRPHSVGNFTKSTWGISELSKLLWRLQYKEEKTSVNRSLEYWINRWQIDQTPWHELHGNATLQDIFPKVWKRVNGDAPMTDRLAFLPLCGKSQDLLYFYRLGFRVVGAELSQKAIDEFFTKNQLQFETIAPNITQTVDGRISIIQGDFYNVELPVQQYDVIWDRGSFGTINLADREKYVNILKPVLKKSNGIYLLSVFEFNSREFHGPPFALSQQDVEKFMSFWSVEKIDSHDMFTEEELKNPQSFGYKFRILFEIKQSNTDIYLIMHK